MGAGAICNTHEGIEEQFETQLTQLGIDQNLSFSEINILDLETRIKKFSSPENKGYISNVQLLKAF